MTSDTQPFSQEFSGIGRRLVVATHRRSGTHLTMDLLRKQFREFQSYKRLGERADRMYLTLEHVGSKGMMSAKGPRRSVDIETALMIMGRATRPLVKTHSMPGFDEWQGESRQFVDELMRDADIYYVYRDGRDVIASLHLYMQYFHPQARCSLGEFIRQDLNGVNFVHGWAEHVRAWLQVPGIRPVKFEDIMRNTRAVLIRLGEEMNIKPALVEPLLPRRLRNIWESRWLRFTSRCPEPSTILGDGYNRKQKAKWKTELSPSDRRFFHEQAGDALIQLGYESSDAWVGDQSASTPRADSARV